MGPGHIPQVGQGQGQERPGRQLPGLIQGLQVGGVGLPEAALALISQAQVVQGFADGGGVMKFPVHGQGFLEAAHGRLLVPLGLGDDPQVVEVGGDAGPAVDEPVVLQGLFKLSLGQVKSALPVILIPRLVEGDGLALKIHTGLGGRTAAQQENENPQPPPPVSHV